MNSYWSRALGYPASRRKVLAATGAATLSASLLVACGSKSKSSSSGAAKGESGLVTKPVDTFAQAKRGGTLKYYITSEPRNLDWQEIWFEDEARPLREDEFPLVIRRRTGGPNND